MKSMTGFGRAKGKAGSVHFSVEARSVNHRFLEVNVRLPGRLAFLEPEVAKRVRERFQRGKFDVFIRDEVVDRERREIDLMKKTHSILQKIRKELKIREEVTLSHVLSARGSLIPSSEGAQTEPLRAPLLKTVAQALDGLDRMRSSEGGRLQNWFVRSLRRMETLVKTVDQTSRHRGDTYRKRLKKKWSALGPDRVLQESAMMQERADVTEEIVRFRSHIQEFKKWVASSASNGRKLDFLAQEMGREINTIGSKSQEVRISRSVIELKSDLEKVREQVQNVE